MQLASQVNWSCLRNFWTFLLERIQDKEKIIIYRIVCQDCVVRCNKWKKCYTKNCKKLNIIEKTFLDYSRSVCLFIAACECVWQTCACVCVCVFMYIYYISFSRQSIACFVWVIPFQFCVSTRTSECNMINDVKRPVNAVSCDLWYTAHCTVVKEVISFNRTRNNHKR